MKHEPHLETVCPRCGKVYTGYPALSRVDNSTLICSLCGAAEALEMLGISEDDQEHILEIIHTHKH